MPGPTVAVVLAGGASSRFGSDKLETLLDGQRLFDVTLAALPPVDEIIVVGPERPVARPVRFVRESPPGGGPAAGLVAGLRFVRELAPVIILVLPGDAPRAGKAARTLRAALDGHPGAVATVGVDPYGREQPLQLALRLEAADQLMRAAGADGGTGRSARALVAALDPPPVRVALLPTECADVDTPDDLRQFTDNP